MTEHKAIIANNVSSVSSHVIDIDDDDVVVDVCVLASASARMFCQLKVCQIGNKASIDY